MINIKNDLKPTDLLPKIDRLWDLSAKKILSIEDSWKHGQGAPVFTVEGKYTVRGWTEWTQGFQYGSAILQYDATGDEQFLQIGRENTVSQMASHVSHFGVHDHGFNNVSTYGNLLRLMNEGRIPEDKSERDFYELALKISGSVQARRWTQTGQGRGYIYSFNGPHSLFADTVRSLRALAVSHKLGHTYMGEKDSKISLLERLIEHAITTAEFTVYYGEGRDAYDIRGRVAHESIFNTNDGSYRCPNSQQGYSPFSTWTRGHAWVVCGYPEELEFLESLKVQEIEANRFHSDVEDIMVKASSAVCDFYIDQTPTDGIPYWDTGAPELHRLGDYLNQPAQIHNDFEPVDSSAAAIAAQGLLRFGRYLQKNGKTEQGTKYFQTGLTVADRLLDDDYLSTDSNHQGLILHSIYHRPNGWDHVPAGSKIPLGESSMWGDYHARELALYIQRLAKDEPYYTFFGPK